MQALVRLLKPRMGALLLLLPLLAHAAPEPVAPVPFGVSTQAWASISAIVQGHGLLPGTGEGELALQKEAARFRALVAGLEGGALGTALMSGDYSPANLRSAASRQVEYWRRWYVWTSGDVRDLKRSALRALVQGDFPLAASFLQSAADFDERAAGDGSWRPRSRLRSAAATREQLGLLAELRLDFLRAARHYQQAAAGVPQDAEAELATYLNKWGRTLIDGKNAGPAEAPLRRALQIRERLLPPGHPDTALTLVNLGSAYEAIGRLDAAADYTERALKAREAVVGTGSPMFIENLEAMARVREGQGRIDESEALLNRALALAERAFGPDGAQSAIPVDRLGMLYHRAGRHADAAIMRARLLRLNTRLLGPTHPETLRARDLLASSQFFNGKPAEAEALFVQSLQIREQAFGDRHPAVIENLCNLGKVYLSAGRLAAAGATYSRAMSIAGSPACSGR